MGQALYRKYRPKALAEVVGQEHITNTLGNALKKGAISHAYLFTGPRGVGKTSIARILAHEVNQLPYDEETTHLDIIEIDAASNRRIDEIRDLRERVHTAPTSAKYKVYIIDEVHMLTKEAFNALLKTLEEPPKHVIFILATTESHKLPETIVSRTQRYSFKPIDPNQVAGHLRSLAKQEGVAIDDAALGLIAEHGGGSFRDSISLLDQVRNVSDKVDSETVRRSLGIAPNEAVDALWDAITSHDTPQLIGLLNDLRNQGYQSGQLAKQLSKRFRNAVMYNDDTIDSAKLLGALKELLEVPSSHDADMALEIVLVGLTLDGTPPQNTIFASPLPASPQPTPPPPPEHKPTITTEEQVEVPEDSTTKPPQVVDDATWSNILEAMKKRHNTLYGVLRMANAQFDQDGLTLTFEFDFHRKRIDEARNKQVVVDVVKQVLGRDVPIICINGTKAKTAAKPSQPKKDAPIDTISNIFGGAEVIE